MFTSTKIGSGSKSLNKTSPGFFLKSPAVLALGIVLVAVLVLVALFVVKQRKASNAKRTTATAVTIPTLSAEASPKTTPPATPPPPVAASPETTPPAKTTPPPAKDPLYARLAATKVPMVAFRDAPLDQVLATLTELSSGWDPEKKGFKIVYLGDKKKKPLVSIQVTGLPWDRTLDSVAKATGFEWTVNHGVVEFRLNSGPQAPSEPKTSKP